MPRNTSLGENRLACYDLRLLSLHNIYRQDPKNAKKHKDNLGGFGTPSELARRELQRALEEILFLPPKTWRLGVLL